MINMTSRPLFIFIWLFVFVGGLFLSLHYRAHAEENRLYVGKFSERGKTGTLPAGWEPLHFKKKERHTLYELVEDNGYRVIRAVSDASSSGLIRKMDIDPYEYPIISWRWKISNTYEKGDVSRKEGDDYPARVYVTFAYDAKDVGFFEKAKFQTARLFYGEYPPIAAINYIWGSKTEKGAVIPNAYTKRVMMIVVESGEERNGVWVEYERNILEDYKLAFGKMPPRISGVAIMTDSDDTKEATTTYYGDIYFKKNEPLPGLK